VTCLNVNALNNVSVLSGNKTTVPAVAPINVKNNSLLNRILGHSWAFLAAAKSRGFVFLAATDPGGNGAVTS
jgi:hypothetical protein